MAGKEGKAGRKEGRKSVNRQGSGGERDRTKDAPMW